MKIRIKNLPFFVKFEGYINQASVLFSNLSARDRYMIAGVFGGVSILVALLLLHLTLSSLDGLKVKIDGGRETAERISSLKLKYAEIKGRLKTIEEEIEKNPGFSLTAYIEKAAMDVGLSENLDNVKEKEGATMDKYREAVVEVKFRKVALDEIVKYLFKLQSEEKPVKVKTLKIKTRYEGGGLLDVTIEVGAYKKI